MYCCTIRAQNTLYGTSCRQATITTVGGQVTRDELRWHMSRVNNFWDYVIEQHSRGKLPGLFHTDSGWLKEQIHTG